MKKKDLIYRIRPINEYTLDELRNSYLWFSRPTKFKGDIQDANIGAFVTDTPAIKRGFKLVCPNFQFDKWFHEMSYIGICCFSRSKPSAEKLSNFPRCKKGKGICIVYDKQKMSTFFETQKKYPLYPCFHEVVYAQNPTKLETLDEWSILWEKKELGLIYKTIPGILHEHPRILEVFIFKLLTRLTEKFKNQEEMRIILAGKNIPSHDENTTGYKIKYPYDIIERIIVYPDVNEEWIKKLKSIKTIQNKIYILE